MQVDRCYGDGFWDPVEKRRILEDIDSAKVLW